MTEFFEAGQPIEIPFVYSLTKAAEETHRGEKVRKLGGYLTTASADRDGQEMIATLTEGAINTTPYREYGVWNDNHFRKTGEGVIIQITVGYPTDLEYHKGKGWYTEGYLLPDVPEMRTELPIARANYYWTIARSLQLMKGLVDRNIGISAEGTIDQTTPDKKKILRATIINGAICEVPINPDCQLSILKSFFNIHMKSSIKKALDTSAAAPLVKQSFGDPAPGKANSVMSDDEKIEFLVKEIQRRNPKMSTGEAKKILKQILSRR